MFWLNNLIKTNKCSTIYGVDNFRLSNERTTTMYYTGVGLEKMSIEMMSTMSNAAIKLRQMGLVLRTGFDDGAWVAFWMGAKYGRKYDYISKKDVTTIALNIAKTFISENDKLAWDCMTQDAKDRYARNVMLVLGRNCISPSKFLLCWTPNGAESSIHCNTYYGKTGYIGLFIKVARAYKIPVINLQRNDWQSKMDSFLDRIERQRQH